MAISLFGITSMLTCIPLLIFTFTPQLPLADDDIESSLRVATGSALVISQDLAIEEIMFCEYRMGDAGRDLELAMKKYDEDCIAQGVCIVMASYSSWNGETMHSHCHDFSFVVVEIGEGPYYEISGDDPELKIP
ncbi:hypothetical protein RND71_038525 [Anisodus tanguticus]|uniref:Uncharacterized protein n=1 Tax=Anisodus tanguticus TaxID=243964 RepID=A0AAE1R0U6_9SOLA|nr:hypothetical protein RND71_038525 [Anisodus tanguticus]